MLQVHLFPLSAMFGLCAAFLAVAALLQVSVGCLDDGCLCVCAAFCWQGAHAMRCGAHVKQQPLPTSHRACHNMRWTVPKLMATRCCCAHPPPQVRLEKLARLSSPVVKGMPSAGSEGDNLLARGGDSS